MRCVLGFDGGGTKTECVLMDEVGEVRARTRTGPSNPTRIGLEVALVSLLDAASSALAKACLAASDVAVICGGVAGAGQANLGTQLMGQLQPHFPNAQISIYNDLSLTLAVAGEPPNIVIIAGTGSAVIGRDVSGKLARAGGFGPVFGDLGSAYDIGRKAVVLGLSQSLRGVEKSPLSNEILHVLKMNWVELQDKARIQPDAVFPQVFPVVAKAANGGDDSARSLLRDAAEELRDLVVEVIDRLQLRDEIFLLTKTGGVFGRSAILDEYFDALIREIAPKVKLGQIPVPLAEAAARMALNNIDSPRIDVG